MEDYITYNTVLAADNFTFQILGTTIPTEVWGKEGK